MSQNDRLLNEKKNHSISIFIITHKIFEVRTSHKLFSHIITEFIQLDTEKKNYIIALKGSITILNTPQSQTKKHHPLISTSTKTPSTHKTFGTTSPLFASRKTFGKSHIFRDEFHETPLRQRDTRACK